MKATVIYPNAATGVASPLELGNDSAGAGYEYISTYTIPYTSGTTTATHVHTATGAQTLVVSVAANN